MKTIVKGSHERVYDENGFGFRWEYREYEKKILEDSDRYETVQGILRGQLTPEEARKRHSLSSLQVIYGWIGKYVSEHEVLSSQEISEEEMARKSKDEQIKELKAQLKQAKKEAEYEKLRAHAFDTMINLAEEKFNIPIRKKSGTKR